MIDHPVQRIVVASSMSVYGEGYYAGPHNDHHPERERASDAVDRWLTSAVFGAGEAVAGAVGGKPTAS